MNIKEKIRYLQNETGRSLLEILGMLAIMSILSIVGAWAYRLAMDRNKANLLINEAQKRAVIIASQIGLNNTPPQFSRV